MSVSVLIFATATMFESRTNEGPDAEQALACILQLTFGFATADVNLMMLCSVQRI